MLLFKIICLIIGYCCGLFQSGYIYAKAHGVNIKEQGSGNAGTTNVLRVMGWKAGAFTFVGDAVKMLVCAFLIRIVCMLNAPEIDADILVLYGALGCVLGHNFPFYLKFKGGKGIAVTSVVTIALLDWRYIVIAYGLFFIMLAIFRMVSVSSLCLVTGFFVAVLVTVLTGSAPFDAANGVEAIIMTGIIAVLAFVQHRSNIVRIVNGTENKFSLHRNKAKEE